MHGCMQVSRSCGHGHGTHSSATVSLALSAAAAVHGRTVANRSLVCICSITWSQQFADFLVSKIESQRYNHTPHMHIGSIACTCGDTGHTETGECCISVWCGVVVICAHTRVLCSIPVVIVGPPLGGEVMPASQDAPSQLSGDTPAGISNCRKQGWRSRKS